MMFPTFLFINFVIACRFANRLLLIMEHLVRLGCLLILRRLRCRIPPASLIIVNRIILTLCLRRHLIEPLHFKLLLLLLLSFVLVPLFNLLSIYFSLELLLSLNLFFYLILLLLFLFLHVLLNPVSQIHPFLPFLVLLVLSHLVDSIMLLLEHQLLLGLVLLLPVQLFDTIRHSLVGQLSFVAQYLLLLLL